MFPVPSRPGPMGFTNGHGSYGSRQDENLYTVSLDDPAISCSVQLDRLDGMSRHLKAMLKADSDAKCIWWGAGGAWEELVRCECR